MKTKTVKIALEGFGSHLGMEKGCFVVRDRNGLTERYPLFENQSARADTEASNRLHQVLDSQRLGQRAILRSSFLSCRKVENL
jgi:hypothetical protein